MGEMNEHTMPKYESDTYYNVVIGGESFMGWKAIYVGLGKMVFVHKDLDDISINKGMSDDWMRECWDEFISIINRD